MANRSSPDVFADGPIKVDVFDSDRVAEFDKLVAAGLATRTGGWEAPEFVYSPAVPAPIGAPAVEPGEGQGRRNLPGNSEKCSAPTEPAKRPEIAVEPSSGGSGMPRPRVPTRQCMDQPEHRKALWTYKALKVDPYVLFVAVAVHNMIGVSQKTAFGSRPERISAKLISDVTGLGIVKARQSIARAVELGVYRRVDGGKGGNGRAGSTAAAYLPTLPEWWK